jgi:hypothetical protein
VRIPALPAKSRGSAQLCVLPAQRSLGCLSALVVLLLTGCRSEAELANARAEDAARACAAETSASQLSTVDAPLAAMDDGSLILRVRPSGLVLDTRAALAALTAARQERFRRDRVPAPLALDALAPVCTEGWLRLPMLERALKDYEATLGKGPRPRRRCSSTSTRGPALRTSR